MRINKRDDDKELIPHTYNYSAKLQKYEAKKKIKIKS